MSINPWLDATDDSTVPHGAPIDITEANFLLDNLRAKPPGLIAAMLISLSKRERVLAPQTPQPSLQAQWVELVTRLTQELADPRWVNKKYWASELFFLANCYGGISVNMEEAFLGFIRALPETQRSSLWLQYAKDSLFEKFFAEFVKNPTQKSIAEELALGNRNLKASHIREIWANSEKNFAMALEASTNPVTPSDALINIIQTHPKLSVIINLLDHPNDTTSRLQLFPPSVIESLAKASVEEDSRSPSGFSVVISSLDYPKSAFKFDDENLVRERLRKIKLFRSEIKEQTGVEFWEAFKHTWNGTVDELLKMRNCFD